MERRNFLKLAASGAVAVTALKGSLLQPRGLMAAMQNLGSLSLSVLTDQPDIAIARFERLFNQFDLNTRTLTFEDFIVPGVQTGDIALVRNNTLVDFRKSQDDFSRKVLQIAREIKVPREMRDPVLLKFTTPDSQKATTINVYHRQALVKQFDITDRMDGEEIHGTKGALFLTLNHRHARIVDASCKHKTCINMGSINKPGQNLVCIPNELRIAIAGENKLGIDGVVF